MHKKVYPEKDSYIEKSNVFLLKNFGMDELLSICTIDDNIKIYEQVWIYQQITGSITSRHLDGFVGDLTGSLTGSAEFITGSVNSYCD